VLCGANVLAVTAEAKGDETVWMGRPWERPVGATMRPANRVETKWRRMAARVAGLGDRHEALAQSVELLVALAAEERSHAGASD
jgi:hypothetical protein